MILEVEAPLNVTEEKVNAPGGIQLSVEIFVDSP